MADTVTRRILEDQPRRAVVRAEITSDGTGSTDAIMCDISAHVAGPDGTVATAFVIERFDYMCDGMQVVLEFDATTDDFIYNCAGQGTVDFTQDGRYQGYIDPKSTGTTGDIVATTVGHSAGDKASFVFYLRKKD